MRRKAICYFIIKKAASQPDVKQYKNRLYKSYFISYPELGFFLPQLTRSKVEPFLIPNKFGFF